MIEKIIRLKHIAGIYIYVGQVMMNMHDDLHVGNCLIDQYIQYQSEKLKPSI